MIQRIQTIWLLLASVCGFLTFKFSFYSGNKVVNNVKQFSFLNATTGNIFLLLLTALISLGALVLIFLYKNRKLQVRLTILALVISLGNIFLYYNDTKKFVEGNYDISALLPVAMPIFFFLAAQGISRDQKLVKSVDRLR